MDDGAARARASSSSSSHFQVNQEGRKPLFAKSQDQKPELARYKPPGATEAPRRTESISHGSSSAASPAGTRLPRLSPNTKRKNLTLSEAMKLAEQEEQDQDRDHDESQVMDASPSPAPRMWRARKDGEDDKLREKGLEEDHLDAKSRSRKDEKAPETGSRTAETGRELAKVTGNEGSWRERPDWRARPKNGTEWFKELGGKDSAIPDLVPGIEDLPLPSVEDDKEVPSWRRSSASKPSTSPEKSFAWQIDDDFTAGDLQVSNSPRIKTDSRPFANRLKFDENSEIDINSKTRVNTPGSRNTRLDEIHSREVKAGSNIPVQRPRTQSTLSQEHVDKTERPRTANSKLNDIKRREEEGLTPRQLSQAKLAEIQEQNAASRSKSPEEHSVTSSQNSQEHKRTPREKPMWRPNGERTPDGPVPTYRTKEERIAIVRASPRSSVDLGKKKEEIPRPAHKRADSRDLLRQLARATSASPAPDVQPKKSALSNRNSSSSSDRRSPRRAQTATTIASRKKNGKGTTKPSVGFANLRRVKSSESSSGSKRSSVHSEDPTARIDAEINLFAPKDDYSEMGSVRASSPASDSKKDSEAEVEATPKAPKFDPKTMPTPRAPGAYVETPVTIKSHRFETDVQSNNEIMANIRSRRALRRRDTDTNSEPGEDEKPSSASAPKTRRPRSSSLPRRRSVKNSALPASVKADLEELKRSFNLEDSIADATFEDILLGAASPQLKAELDEMAEQAAEEDSFDQTLKEYSELPARKPTLEVKPEPIEEKDLDAHNGRIEKDLRDTHSLQEKVERLQNDLAHTADSKPEIKQETPPPPVHAPAYAPAPAPSSTIAYIMLPVPRLWTSKPKLRLTFLGLLLFIMGLWYTLEAGMCTLYCQPATCTAPPCVWSYDDPTFGKALPVKLDQWTTGGLGRDLINTAAENVEDWLADILNAAYGRQITEIDVDSLTIEEKRAHRRRLRKKGLLKRHDDTNPDARARWDAWHRERVAQQHARDLREMGYHSVREEDESIGGDERVW